LLPLARTPSVAPGARPRWRSRAGIGTGGASANRDVGAEDLLKRQGSGYGVDGAGRLVKVVVLVDAVLMPPSRGPGGRDPDGTFGLDGDRLAAFAKPIPAERRGDPPVDAFRADTLKHKPVSGGTEPGVQLAFEGIRPVHGTSPVSWCGFPGSHGGDGQAIREADTLGGASCWSSKARG
jgi:hypothetical protein